MCEKKEPDTNDFDEIRAAQGILIDPAILEYQELLEESNLSRTGVNQPSYDFLDNWLD